MFMHICLPLDDVISPWGSNNPSDFVGQRFVGFQAVIWIFRAIDRLPRISGSKIMAKYAEIN